MDDKQSKLVKAKKYNKDKNLKNISIEEEWEKVIKGILPLTNFTIYNINFKS